MTRIPPEDMERQELETELLEARAQLDGADHLRSVIEELSVHQEELRQQQQELSIAQREIELSRNRYAELFDFAPLGYATLDLQGVIVDINFAAAQLLGHDRARLQGMPLVVHVAPVDRRKFLDQLARCRRGEHRVRGELSLRAANDERIPIELTLKRVSSRNGVASFSCALSDQREREIFEEERRRAAEETERLMREEAAARAASEAKDRFLAVLSHELRSPLSPIVFGVAALEQSGGLTPATLETLAMIRRNVELEARLIDDLLDVTRIARGKLKVELRPVELHELLENVCTMCEAEAARSGQTLRFDARASRSHVRGDPVRLRQVFWNLLQNALHVTPSDGAISISTRNDSKGRVVIAVQDGGPGVPPGDVERIFAPFEQAETVESGRGLGLGLAICKGLLEAHGGAIHVVDSGAGACFQVELDTIDVAPERAPDERAPDVSLRLPASILLVEDHVDTAELLARLLAAKGCRVRVAHTVADALAVPDGEFEIVLSDVQLPDASGVELMQKLRERRRQIRGIAMSGFGFDRDVRRSLDAGFTRHLTKPVKVEDVLRAIDEVARGQSGIV